MSAGEGARGAPIPRVVVVLGVVSFLTDLSSEAIFAVLPLFFTAVLGGSTVALGAMEGLSDLAASSLDMASGYLSDRWGKRKAIALFGYSLSSIAKAVLIAMSTATQVIAFRVVERLGKSIRSAPRDALLAEVAQGDSRGALFGLHKALDKAGAIAGPLCAYALLARFGHSLPGFRRFFTVATVPALVSVLVLAFFVRERAGAPQPHGSIRERLRSFGPRYRHYLVSACAFSLSYFSSAFLMLALSRVGFEMKQVALLYGLLNLSFTIASIPVGWLGDRIGRRVLIAVSYALFAAVAAGFALVHTKAGAVAFLVLYGVFYAIDEGQTKAYLADLVPEHARATAIGTYGFVTALAYLPASLVFGFLWRVRGPGMAFFTAGGLALFSFGYFLTFEPQAKDPRAEG